MPWGSWKSEAFSVSTAEKFRESGGCRAEWRGQKLDSGSRMREAHWRPLAVRYWQRSGVRAGLGDVVFMESFFIFHHFENLSGGGLYPPVLQKRGWKMLKTKKTRVEKERQEGWKL